eukprot:CAMPEP_0119567592 /NCGR_PEP_ID=MMETSP1352-20130426/36371_1 /TAXON_ID=265584 /ORGANISM="Stauroneis constricta, Strain CCMP1120" /LENGTH=159 /DNA_ID=CAMNT_0007616867 /DNA_START=126 /DNA_END=601 /DNA_ORIENTATION=+
MCKSVCFREERNKSMEVESHHDLTSDEKKQLYYSKLELAERQREDQRLMKSAMRGTISDDHEFDPRGLENRRPDQSFMRKTTTIAVIQGVLDEQDRQRCGSVKDDEIIAEICRELSYMSRKAARKFGKADAMCIPEVAKKITEEQDTKRTRKASLEPPP